MQSTQLELFAVSQPPPFFGKTCPEFSVQPITPSDAFLALFPGKMSQSSRQGKNGRTLVVCLAPKEQSRGGSKTPNISEWPNDAAVCSLSQVLETGLIPQRYFLSSTACAGILRRAEKRGKTLPALLQVALAAVAFPDQMNHAADTSSQSIASPTDKGGAEMGINRSPTLTCNHEAPILAATLLKGGHSNNPLDETLIATCSVPIAFSSKDYGGDAMLDCSPTLSAGNHSESHANAGCPPAFAFVQNSRDEVRLMGGDGQIVGALAAQPGMKQTCYVAQAICITGDITHTLKAEGFDASEDGTGRGQPIVAAHSMAVRRLTPRVSR